MDPPIVHGLCVMAGSWVIATVPTREWPLAMGYHRLWVIRGMDYNGVDCSHLPLSDRSGPSMTSLLKAAENTK